MTNYVANPSKCLVLKCAMESLTLLLACFQFIIVFQSKVQNWQDLLQPTRRPTCGVYIDAPYDKFAYLKWFDVYMPLQNSRNETYHTSATFQRDTPISLQMQPKQGIHFLLKHCHLLTKLLLKKLASITKNIT